MVSKINDTGFSLSQLSVQNSVHVLAARNPFNTFCFDQNSSVKQYTMWTIVFFKSDKWLVWVSTEHSAYLHADLAWEKHLSSFNTAVQGRAQRSKPLHPVWSSSAQRGDVWSVWRCTSCKEQAKAVADLLMSWSNWSRSCVHVCQGGVGTSARADCNWGFWRWIFNCPASCILVLIPVSSPP